MSLYVACFLFHISWTVSIKFNISVCLFLEYDIHHAIIAGCLLCAYLFHCFYYLLFCDSKSFCTSLLHDCFRFIELFSDPHCIHFVYYSFILDLIDFLPFYLSFICSFPFIRVSYWSINQVKNVSLFFVLRECL